MKKQMIFSALIALTVSLSSIGIYNYINKKDNNIKIEHVATIPTSNAVYSLDKEGNAIPLNFNKTAKKVLGGVVHIKSTQVVNMRNRSNDLSNIPAPFRDFFGPQFNSPQLQQNSPAKVGTGSGVIISNDGYIVTNNHVIDNSDDIEVTLHDNRTYKAKVVGTDPSTDLAVIQIKETDLPIVPFIDSDMVDIGQWVLAVGNPLGLNSTVTAGIVSAKGRNINILKDKYAVENFIQTDAAINPGNSGGALVNLNGGLVGINTAIASPTGTFTGYGFAVPTNIVKKVVNDILEYGVVQRGVLGVMIRTIDGNFAKEKEIEITQGVYVDKLIENSAAEKAGIKEGDIITSINEINVKTAPELQGIIARHRPGESITIKINRNGKEKAYDVILKNRNGNTSIESKSTHEVIRTLGVEFEDINKKQAKKLGITHGVKLKKLYAGKLSKHTQIREGFIITKVNDKKVDSSDSLVKILDNTKGGVMLEGVYEDIPGVYYYAFGL